MPRENVLFLCTGNSARSQMGEAFLRHYAGERFDVYSAGLEPKGLNPYTIRTMEEIGIDVRGQTSNSLLEYMGKVDFRYVITVCGHADENCPAPLWKGGEKLHWPFEDPAAETEEAVAVLRFREIREQIRARIQDWLRELGEI